MEKNEELTKQRIRFYSLLNGLLAITYIVGIAYFAASIYNMLF
jgi:hypothetical protein